MSARKHGFTLVEILIVVVILGILAAIVIPQFTSASESAKGSSLMSQLQTLRSQLELYQIQHNGEYPTTWTQLTGRTNAAGDVGDADATSTTHPYGPYLQQPSRNPFITAAEGANLNGVGWEYSPTTGQIRAYVTSAQQAVRAGIIAAEADLTASHPDLVVKPE